MSLTEIIAEVDRLSAADRAELRRRLRARELADDPQRTADVSAKLDRALHREGIADEEVVRQRLAERGFTTG